MHTNLIGNELFKQNTMKHQCKSNKWTKLGIWWQTYPRKPASVVPMAWLVITPWDPHASLQLAVAFHRGLILKRHSICSLVWHRWRALTVVAKILNMLHGTVHDFIGNTLIVLLLRPPNSITEVSQQLLHEIWWLLLGLKKEPTILRLLWLQP